MAQKIQNRRGSPQLATTNNEILAPGEIGIEIDGLATRTKVGNGVTPWNDLPYEDEKGNGTGTVVDATDLVKGKVLLSKAGSATALAANESLVVEGKKSYYAADYALVAPNALQAAADAANAVGGGEVVVSSVLNITSATTTQKTVAVKFTAGGAIVANGATVTIGLLDAESNRRIFSTVGTGKVLLGRGAVNRLNLTHWTGIGNTADVTKEMSQAIESLALNQGGVLDLPSGEVKYIPKNLPAIPNGSIFWGKGRSHQPSSGGVGQSATRIIPDRTGYAAGEKCEIFRVPENARSVFLFDLAVDGNGLPDCEGLVITGSNPNATVGVGAGRVSFHNLSIGAQVKSTSPVNQNPFNVEQITFDNCDWENCNVSWFNNSNNTSVTFLNPYMMLPSNGKGFDLLRSGKLNIIGGNGVALPGAVNTTLFDFRGEYLAPKILGFQDEGVGTFIEVNVSQITDAINIEGCLIQSRIQLNKSCVVNSKGNRMLANSVFCHPTEAAVVFNSDGDTFPITIDSYTAEYPLAHAQILGQPNLSANGVLMSEAKHCMFENTYGVANIKGSYARATDRTEQYTEFVLNKLQFGGQLNRAAVTIATGEANKPALHITSTDVNDRPLLGYGYDFYRNESTGALEFKARGSEAGKRYNFDAPIYSNGVLLGAAGGGSYVYTAYADADDGTGFTQIFNANKNFIAFKTSATVIENPVQADFAGLWKNYKGTQGIQGIQGIQGAPGAPGADGSSVTGANIGTGAGVFKSKGGVELNFRKLKQEQGIKITENLSDISIATDFADFTRPSDAEVADLLALPPNADFDELLRYVKALSKRLGASVFAPPIPALLTDNGVTAIAAWELRQVVSGYTGAGLDVYDTLSANNTPTGFAANGNFDWAEAANVGQAANLYVSKWYDPVNAIHLVQTDPAKMPKLNLTTKTVDFSGGRYLQTNAPLPLTDKASVFTRLKTNSAGGFNVAFELESRDLQLVQDGTNYLSRIARFNGSELRNLNAVPGTVNFHVISMVIDRLLTAANALKVRIDGIQTANEPDAFAAQGTDFGSPLILQVGARFNGVNLGALPFDGSIKGLILTNNILTDTQRNALEAGVGIQNV